MSFASQYTRNPLVEQLEEDQHWLYCKETNTKLLPMTLFELAKTFVSGENYNDKLDQLCNDHGREEGGDIVDKHSGFVLRKSDFQEEEMFDDSGFRITTHSLLEKELGDVYASAKGKQVKCLCLKMRPCLLFTMYWSLFRNAYKYLIKIYKILYCVYRMNWLRRLSLVNRNISKELRK